MTSYAYVKEGKLSGDILLDFDLDEAKTANVIAAVFSGDTLLAAEVGEEKALSASANSLTVNLPEVEVIGEECTVKLYTWEKGTLVPVTEVAPVEVSTFAPDVWSGEAAAESDAPKLTDMTVGEETVQGYAIYNADQLAWFAVNGGSANAILMDDIYLNDFFESDGVTFDEDWYETARDEENHYTTPDSAITKDWYNYAIGRRTPYSGVFDGQGKTIYGLYTTANNNTIGGLFAQITDGTVKNLNIKGAYIVSSRSTNATQTSTGKAAVLAAIVSGANIESVNVGGKITTKNANCSSHIAGSVVAHINTGEKKTTIKNCTSDVDIDLSNSAGIGSEPSGTSASGVGGIVGAAQAGTRYMVEITGCTNNGDINAPKAYRAAGILAWTSASTYLTNFTDNLNSGNIYGGTKFSGKLIAAEKGSDASAKYTDNNTPGGTATKSN